MKKSIFAFAAAMAASMVSADILYWQVSEDFGQEFNYAALYATLKGTNSAADGTPVGYYNYGTSGTTMSTPEVSSDVGDSNNIGGFYVGLYGGSPLDLVGTSKWLSLSDVAAALEKADAEGKYVQSHSQVATFTPEPTSGMLMLVGLAALALRRQRKVS